MDVARILILTKCFDVFNMVVYDNINGSMFHIKILEEWCGPMHWEGVTQAYEAKGEDFSSDSEGESEEDDGPPLFVADDVRVGDSDGYSDE